MGPIRRAPGADYIIAALLAMKDSHTVGIKERAVERSGTVTTKDQVEAITKKGVVVNLADRTVSGFGGVVVPIDTINAAEIQFSYLGAQTSVDGVVDRVTGTVEAKVCQLCGVDSWADKYKLLCKVTDRLF
jgi:hypothetical protein